MVTCLFSHAHVDASTVRMRAVVSAIQTLGNHILLDRLKVTIGRGIREGISILVVRMFNEWLCGCASHSSSSHKKVTLPNSESVAIFHCLCGDIGTGYCCPIEDRQDLHSVAHKIELWLSCQGISQ